MTLLPIDYGTLREIWWLLLGILLIGFAILDGYDFGTAMLHPFIARNDAERRIFLNAIGPTWEGNQVWLILGGGAIFAAWPPLYAASFSGFYLAMFLVLSALILRPVAIGYRSKMEGRLWRERWDWIFFVSGVVPSLIFGVAFGNLFEGVPFHFDPAMRLIYEGGLLGLLNPFALLCGLVSMAMLCMQGAAWLLGKTQGTLRDRIAKAGIRAALILLALFSIAGVYVAFGIDGYALKDAVDPAGPSNPLAQNVVRDADAWLRNFRLEPRTMAAPGAAYLGTLLALLGLYLRTPVPAFLASSLAVAGIIATAGISLFPFLLPSSTVPGHSLTVWNASSSPMTLKIMLGAVMIFLPIVLAYTSFVYRVMRGPVATGLAEGDAENQY